MKTVFTAMFFASFSMALCAAQPPRVELGNIALEGTRQGDSHAFLGIPYAQPPVGGLRWQPPQALALQPGTRPAVEYGPACPQPAMPLSGRAEAPDTSEDCLTLNVWTPAGFSGEKLPVLFWIHGGAFRFGSGETRGDLVAPEGFVVVSINYRLGPLGFFTHEALAGRPANPGILDMIAALGWVRDNIAAFGGDPGRVTIFGVSAGGMAVNLLMTSDGARGLFHGAIAQSGYATWALPRSDAAPVPAPLGMGGEPAPDAEAMGAKLIARLSPTQQDLEMLMSLDAQSLAEAVEGFHVPIVDGASLREEPGIRFLKGEQHSVPYISGGNSFEGSIMAMSGFSQEGYREQLGSDLANVRALYATDDEDTWLARQWGDARYLISARAMTGAMARVDAPAWLYYIDFLPPSQRGRQPGTAHGADAYYFWQGPLSPDPSVRRFAETLRGYWFNFARRATPNGSELPLWPTYQHESDLWLVLSAMPGAREGVIGKKLDFLHARYLDRVGAALE